MLLHQLLDHLVVVYHGVHHWRLMELGLRLRLLNNQGPLTLDDLGEAEVVVFLVEDHASDFKLHKHRLVRRRMIDLESLFLNKLSRWNNLTMAIKHKRP